MCNLRFSKLHTSRRLNEPGETVQGIFGDDVSQDGGLQHLDIEEEILFYQETQTETKDLSVLFPRHGEGEPLTYF